VNGGVTINRAERNQRESKQTRAEPQLRKVARGAGVRATMKGKHVNVSNPSAGFEKRELGRSRGAQGKS